MFFAKRAGGGEEEGRRLVGSQAQFWQQPSGWGTLHAHRARVISFVVPRMLELHCWLRTLRTRGCFMG